MSFSSELRFMRALDLYNHCHAMDFALVGGNDGFGGGLFPAACGLGSGAMQGPAAPFRPEQKASIHLWINDKLDAVGFKKECQLRCKGMEMRCVLCFHPSGGSRRA